MSQTAQCLRHISHEPGVHSANGNNEGCVKVMQELS